MSNVKMLPGADRPDGALSWLGEELGNGGVRGVIVIAVHEDGIDPRVFGSVRRYEMAYAAAVLSNHSVVGEFE